MKIIELLKSAVANALAHPKTTATGLTSIIIGIDLLSKHNIEGGILAIVTGLGLVLSKDN